MATNENLPPNVIKQLVKELRNLDESPRKELKYIVHLFTNLCFHVSAGTPYENGTFRMKLLLSHDFPQSPPKGFFLTKIFHPNISSSGEICVNTLKKDWSPCLGLRHILLVIRCLLIEPFPESALNEQAGKMLLENYEEYARHASLYTGIHASKPKPKFKTGAISESTTVLNVEQQNGGAPLLVPNAPAAASPSRAPAADHGGAVAADSAAGSSAGDVLAPRRKPAATAAKVQALDKKKMDARKKSLKRL
ncbi:unnamed protein product [Spirodela intermedia]|uniref:E2 ubiquitin-conjugating enzyme n=1 Tax=Spirodela intermedia TaxID=51605 RepID=A0A7I8IVV5_SPIIN|nr:unnamed protein product [Spirodela intermedia]CAA6661949.1 unnamed protein product [Spirodela intermedia]